MVELGTRCTTERVQVGNSSPKAARTVFLPDPLDWCFHEVSKKYLEQNHPN